MATTEVVVTQHGDFFVADVSSVRIVAVDGDSTGLSVKSAPLRVWSRPADETQP